MSYDSYLIYAAERLVCGHIDEYTNMVEIDGGYVCETCEEEEDE